MTAGIDVSHWDGHVDFFTVRRAGYEFAGQKVSEGPGNVDQTFAANWAAMGRAGLVRIGYHFARPEQSNPVDQASHFLGALGGTLQPGDICVLDLEQTGLGPAATTAWASTWLSTVQARTGRTPLLYCGPGFIRSHLANPGQLTSWPLWLAQYGPRANVWPWPTYTIWQYSQTGRVPGVPTACDLNRTNLTAGQLRALGTPKAAPQVPTAFQLAMMNLVRASWKPPYGPVPPATPATWAEACREFCLVYDAVFHQHLPVVDRLDDAWNGRVGQCVQLLMAG